MHVCVRVCVCACVCACVCTCVCVRMCVRRERACAPFNFVVPRALAASLQEQPASQQPGCNVRPLPTALQPIARLLNANANYFTNAHSLKDGERGVRLLRALPQLQHSRSAAAHLLHALQGGRQEAGGVCVRLLLLLLRRRWRGRCGA